MNCHWAEVLVEPGRVQLQLIADEAATVAPGEVLAVIAMPGLLRGGVNQKVVLSAEIEAVVTNGPIPQGSIA